MSFWDIVWLIIVSFGFIAYLLLLFFILGDLFRDRHTSGWVKAIWIVFLLFLPVLTSLIYLIVRGGGIQERAQEAADRDKQAADAYIRATAGTNPAAQIAEAKRLLAEGTITQEEFDQLKAKALS